MRDQPGMCIRNRHFSILKRSCRFGLFVVVSSTGGGGPVFRVVIFISTISVMGKLEENMAANRPFVCALEIRSIVEWL